MSSNKHDQVNQVNQVSQSLLQAADVCDFIKQKKDLGCKGARDVTTLEEKRGILGNARGFWDIIGGHKPYMGMYSSCGVVCNYFVVGPKMKYIDCLNKQTWKKSNMT